MTQAAEDKIQIVSDICADPKLSDKGRKELIEIWEQAQEQTQQKLNLLLSRKRTRVGEMSESNLDTYSDLNSPSFSDKEIPSEIEVGGCTRQSTEPGQQGDPDEEGNFPPQQQGTSRPARRRPPP